jgi:ribosome-associated GTPase EngA
MAGTVAIVGRPNVGKSALFNRLVGRRLAIVDRVAGITRDRLGAEAEWRGVHFMLTDTGGIVPDPDEPLLEQVRLQAEVAIAEADVVLFVLDVTEGVTPLDQAVAELLRPAAARVVCVANKCDDTRHDNAQFEFAALGFGDVFGVSALHGRRTDALLNEVVGRLPKERAEAAEAAAVRVAIVGKPNVGKSSLLNALLNYNRAIVSDIAGTTRDTIEEQVRIGTHLIRIIDTAGIREASDEIERIGIERSIAAIQESEIVIALFDGSREGDAEDGTIIRLLEEYAGRKEIVTAVNKCDLEPRFDRSAIEAYRPLALNCKTDVTVLVEALRAIMDCKNLSDETMLISTRQIEAVRRALAEIEEAMAPLEDQELEIFSFHLTQAVNAIASITRPYEHDEMLDKMFGSFCLGK